ncbi:hypothetical protein [Geodermatophilus saharensis]|uniref:hypothetical protein n=1 Tax=Geodermatophilus saharensis TaxID=1137994 RepID=UPI001FE28262|nr:hypothetical protein [Geodermatophilus saharensis]
MSRARAVAGGVLAVEDGDLPLAHLEVVVRPEAVHQFAAHRGDALGAASIACRSAQADVVMHRPVSRSHTIDRPTQPGMSWTAGQTSSRT